MSRLWEDDPEEYLRFGEAQVSGRQVFVPGIPQQKGNIIKGPWGGYHDANKSAVQPDLFGEFDAQQARIEADRQPQTCTHCGTVEPNAFLLRNNHGPEDIWDGRCMAQRLTYNHIWYAARNDPERLDGYLARGRHLGLDVESIVNEARDAQ